MVCCEEWVVKWCTNHLSTQTIFPITDRTLSNLRTTSRWNIILNLPAKTISSQLLFFVMILNFFLQSKNKKVKSYTEEANAWFCINIIFLAGYCGQWSGDWCVQRVSQQQQRITKSTATTTTTHSNNKLSTLSIQWFW